MFFRASRLQHRILFDEPHHLYLAWNWKALKTCLCVCYSTTPGVTVQMMLQRPVDKPRRKSNIYPSMVVPGVKLGTALPDNC